VNIKLGEIKLTAILVFTSIILNAASFLFTLNICDVYLNSGISKSLNAAMTAGNPLNVINDLMKNEQSGKTAKDSPAKKDAENSKDKAFYSYDAVLAPAINFKIQFLPYFCALSGANTQIAFAQSARGLTPFDHTGSLCLFAFLLMYLAILRDSWTVNKISFINKNAAA
jgi:hypothetical protein